jgi:coproporphyrinogen III oxidase-like Fe-S oxidoreductase
MRPGTLQLPALPPLSLYVHLPWCLRKCPYCDFNSHEMQPASLPERATSTRCWPTSKPRCRWSGAAGAQHLHRRRHAQPVLAARHRAPAVDLRARLKLEPDCEITLEANPGTFEKDRFKAFRAAGVTRLSVGVQSFNDAHLKALGRVHDARQAIAAVEEAAAPSRPSTST